jgi:hypothetical protein
MTKPWGVQQVVVVNDSNNPIPTSSGGGGGGATTIADGANVVEGSTTGAAVTTNANGTIQQYLRGIVALLVAKITVKLDAGTNLVGKVGIDQATANANEVVVKSGSVLAALALPANIVSGNSAKIEDTNAANVITTDSGVGIRYYVTDVIVTNGDATVGTLVTIQDDEGSPTVICQGFAAALGGGFSHHFACPVPTATDAHIHAICGTTAAEVYVTVVAYKAA